MIYNNKKIPINIIDMKNVIIEEIDNIIDNKLYFLDIVFSSLKTEIKNNEDKYKDKIKILKNNIIKEIKNKMDTNNFIYRIIDNDHCIFNHTRGKNKGNFCCKRITKNGDKKTYVCTVHNKKHIPKPKINVGQELYTKTIENKDKKYVTNIEIKDKPLELKYINDINHNIIKKGNVIIKNFSNKLKINKKTYINNFNIRGFKNIIEKDYKHHYKYIIDINKNYNKDIIKYKRKIDKIPSYNFLYDYKTNNNYYYNPIISY